MTLFLARVEPHCAKIVMDELCGDQSDPTTSRWTTKVRVVPHLGLALAGTGSASLLGIFATEADLHFEEVDAFLEWSVGWLRHLWRDYVDYHGEDVVYRFSVNPEQPSRLYVIDGNGPRIRWWSLCPPDFTPEPMGYQLICSPIPAAWNGQIAEPFETLDEMSALGKRVKLELDDPAVRMESYGHAHNTIGGALWATTITPGPVFTQARVHVFDDRDDVLRRLRGEVIPPPSVAVRPARPVRA